MPSASEYGHGWTRASFRVFYLECYTKYLLNFIKRTLDCCFSKHGLPLYMDDGYLTRTIVWLRCKIPLCYVSCASLHNVNMRVLVQAQCNKSISAWSSYRNINVLYFCLHFYQNCFVRVRFVVQTWFEPPIIIIDRSKAVPFTGKGDNINVGHFYRTLKLELSNFTRNFFCF